MISNRFKWLFISTFFTEVVAPKTRTVIREGVDVVATGGMDDVVRIWDVTADGELKLKHKLTDHSLGVVSVALNKDVTRKNALLEEFAFKPVFFSKEQSKVYFTNIKNNYPSMLLKESLSFLWLSKSSMFW